MTHTRVEAQATRPSAGLHGVLSKAQLTPPLHSRLRALRFSPDGSHILLQDESTLYVLTRSPLAIQLFLPASLALPARFTVDSSKIVVATRGMRVQRWNLAESKVADTRLLGDGKDCFTATLSSHGDLYACLGIQSDLHVFRVESGEEIFSGRTGDAPGADATMIAPFHLGFPHSEPFGYYIGNLLPPPVEQMVTATNLHFSPDGHYLLSRDATGHVTLVDLQERKKINLGGSLRHMAENGSIDFVAPDRVAALVPAKAEESALLSFPDGRRIEELGIAGSALSTSDPRYLIHVAHGEKDAELIDLQTHKPVYRVSKDGADVFAGEIASYAIDTGLVLLRLDGNGPRVLARIQPGALPVPNTVLASPGLEALALGIPGQGGVFRVSSGAQIASFSSLRGAWFDGEQTCYVRVPGAEPLASALERLNLKTGATENLWLREDVPIKNESLFSGPVLLSEVMKELLMMFDSKRFGYELRALDLNTGKTLWSRDYGGNPPRTGFQDEPPVTFTDPQGDRVVVGWPAKSDQGHAAAMHNPTAKLAMKGTKVTAHDSVFEVLDARTGKTLGVVFVPEGSGPESYSSAFSDGDWLILVKDGIRITVYSLSSGSQHLRFTALIPAVSAETGLLSAAEERGRLLLYDMKSGFRRDYYTFPDNVVYTRFSADGKRLLVLTADQTVYVLDVNSDAAPVSQP